MSDHRSPAELQLRAIAKNVYIVNEKRADRGWRRMWKVHVMIDWRTFQTFWGEDSDAGQQAAIAEALRWAKQHAPTIEEGPSDG